VNFSSPFLALIVYPLLAYFLGDPKVFRWGAEHGSRTPMPHDLEVRALRNGRFLWILRYALLIIYIVWALRQRGTMFQARSVSISYLASCVAGGIAAGVLLIALRNLGSFQWHGLGWRNPTHPILNGATLIWLTIIAVGGFAEEFWRAFCLVGFRQEGLSRIAAILITSVVFALSQLAGRPSRISEKTPELFFTAIVGAFLAQMLVVFHSLLIVVSTNITYSAFCFYKLRKANPTHLLEIA
jgi:membrane protease YdiL (CAAX protease family)